jgi:hypothetical protein
LVSSYRTLSLKWGLPTTHVFIKKEFKMARVLFGNAVQDMRGKDNGNVYSKNRFGPYIRTKVTPVNRRTTFQTAVRATFTVLARLWGSTLTDAQRAAWIAYAAATPFRNIFGLSRALSGHQYFLKLNAALGNIGAAFVLDPPTSNANGDLGVLTLAMAVAAGGSMTLATNESSVPVGALVVVYATPQLSPGINFVKSQLRYIGNFASGGTPYDLKADWVAKYGTFPTVAGKKVFVAAQLITTAGQLSTPAGAAVIVS